MGSGGGRGKGRARGAPADPPTRPCAPHGCNENTVTGTQHAWGGAGTQGQKGRHQGHGVASGGGGRCMWHGVPLNPMGRGTLLLGVGGGGKSCPHRCSQQGCWGPTCSQLRAPCVAPPPSCLVSIRAAASRHLSPRSSASVCSFAYRPRLRRVEPRPLRGPTAPPRPPFTCRPRPPVLHTVPAPPRAASHPERSHLHTDRAPPTSPDLHTVAPPPRRPAHLGALRGAVGADELHEVLERVLPVVVADGGVGEVRPRLGQEGARREVQRRGCGPRAACGDPQCSGPPITSKPLPPEGLLQPHPSPTPRGGPRGGGGM